MKEIHKQAIERLWWAVLTSPTPLRLTPCQEPFAQWLEAKGLIRITGVYNRFAAMYKIRSSYR